MRNQIGIIAGKVWRTLEAKGEVSVPQLPTLVKEKDVMTYQALGWLAHEGKVSYRVERNRTFVSIVR